MRLTDFSVYQYRLPLALPLQLRGVVLPFREGLLVRLAGEAGVEGWGEAAPLPGFSRESLGAAREQLLDLKPALLGRVVGADWTDPEGTFAREMEGRKLHASVRFGLELALGDLLAAARGRTLPEVLLPGARGAVSLAGLLTGSPEDVVQQARRMQAAGYRAVKLKVGQGDLDQECALVCRLAEALKGAVQLRLDANRAWRLEEAAYFAAATAGCAFAYIEEPLADPGALPAFARTYGVPVALDESLLDLSAEGLERHRYACAVVLKPTLLGGIAQTLRLAQKAEELGMTPVLSASFESGVGIRGLLAMASGLGARDTPVGLDTYRWLAADVLCPPLDLQAGRIDVAAVMRTGRGVDRQYLKEISA